MAPGFPAFLAFCVLAGLGVLVLPNFCFPPPFQFGKLPCSDLNSESNFFCSALESFEAFQLMLVLSMALSFISALCIFVAPFPPDPVIMPPRIFFIGLLERPINRTSGVDLPLPLCLRTKTISPAPLRSDADSLPILCHFLNPKSVSFSFSIDIWGENGRLNSFVKRKEGFPIHLQ